MKFYVVRHPWTESNVNNITQGWADSPLVSQGIKTAEKLGNFLRNKSISKIFSSSLGRCIQTSKIINKKLNVKIVKAPQLREQNLGKFNGVNKNTIKKYFDENDYAAIPPRGESFLQMKNRVLTYIKYELPRSDGAILMVTHTGCFQSILSDSLNMELGSKKCKTTPLTVGLFEIKEHHLKFIKRYNLK